MQNKQYYVFTNYILHNFRLSEKLIYQTVKAQVHHLFQLEVDLQQQEAQVEEHHEAEVVDQHVGEAVEQHVVEVVEQHVVEVVEQHVAEAVVGALKMLNQDNRRTLITPFQRLKDPGNKTRNHTA